MAQRFYTNEIITEIIALINSNLKIPLGLKLISRGSMKYLNFDVADLSTKFPLVLVLPENDTVEVGLGEIYDIVHKIRIVYIRKYATTDEIVKNKITDLLKFAELVVDNINLSALSLPNGQIVSSLVDEIEYEPEEDNSIKVLNSELTAGAVRILVHVGTRK